MNTASAARALDDEAGLTSNITNGSIDEHYEAARAQGRSGKLMGAGLAASSCSIPGTRIDVAYMRRWWRGAAADAVPLRFRRARIVANLHRS